MESDDEESSEDEEEVQMKQLEELSIQSPESDAVENAKEVAEDKYVSSGMHYCNV